MHLKFKSREPKLPTKPNTIGWPAEILHGEVFRGKFEKVRLELRPEDVYGQSGSVFSERSAGVVTRKSRSAKNS